VEHQFIISNAGVTNQTFWSANDQYGRTITCGPMCALYVLKRDRVRPSGKEAYLAWVDKYLPDERQHYETRIEAFLKKWDSNDDE
jgi:hypothetical protein